VVAEILNLLQESVKYLNGEQTTQQINYPLLSIKQFSNINYWFLYMINSNESHIKPLLYHRALEIYQQFLIIRGKNLIQLQNENCTNGTVFVLKRIMELCHSFLKEFDETDL